MLNLQVQVGTGTKVVHTPGPVTVSCAIRPFYIPRYAGGRLRRPWAGWRPTSRVGCRCRLVCTIIHLEPRCCLRSGTPHCSPPSLARASRRTTVIRFAIQICQSPHASRTSSPGSGPRKSPPCSPRGNRHSGTSLGLACPSTTGAPTASMACSHAALLTGGAPPPILTPTSWARPSIEPSGEGWRK